MTINHELWFILQKKFQIAMLLINQLSKKTNVPVHTIRYYERFGLFEGKKDAAVKSNNYAWYDDNVVEKLELIKEAKEVGFTLSEIKELLDAWHSNQLSVERKKEVLLNKINEIDGKIQQLKEVQQLLLEAIKDVEAFNC